MSKQIDNWIRNIKNAKGWEEIVKALLIPLAYFLGRWRALEDVRAKEDRMKEAYREIEDDQLTDQKLDDMLDKGDL